MRWLSSVAILFYLSLLCMPQALAVHDVRLSPLADSQLYAITPTLPQPILSSLQDIDDAPVALLPTPLTVTQYADFPVIFVALVQVGRLFTFSVQARAPPQLSFP